MGDLASLFAFMDAQVGVGETPPGSNHVVLRDGTDLWRDIYGYQPPASQAAWCALFQSTCELRNGTPLPAIDFRYGYVGVDAGRAWFARNGLLVPAPKPGYLVFYNEHTGRVRSLTGTWPCPFYSLEGNEGDAVRLVLRNPSEVVGGFGVREYAAIPAPNTPKEEDMAVYIQPPGQDSKFRDPNGVPIEVGVIKLPAGTKGSVCTSSDRAPANGANLRRAIGSDRVRPGNPSGVWQGRVDLYWNPAFTVRSPYDASAGDEIASVWNYGPMGVELDVDNVVPA